jgi:hypothetical protein
VIDGTSPKGIETPDDARNAGVFAHVSDLSADDSSEPHGGYSPRAPGNRHAGTSGLERIC